MKIPINSILTLENQKKYIVLKSINYLGEIYYLLALIENNNIMNNDLLVIKFINNNESFTIIKDPNIIEEIINRA